MLYQEGGGTKTVRNVQIKINHLSMQIVWTDWINGMEEISLKICREKESEGGNGGLLSTAVHMDRLFQYEKDVAAALLQEHAARIIA